MIFVFVCNSSGSTDSTESFKRGSGKYGSFRKRPTKDDVVIYSFEFEECVLAAYNSEPVECTVHGQLELKELAPDAVRVLKPYSFYPVSQRYISDFNVSVFALLLSSFQPIFWQFPLAKIELSVAKMDFNWFSVWPMCYFCFWGHNRFDTPWSEL